MKKRLFAMALALVLALGCVPALADPAPEAPALPAVGEVVHGFEVMEQRDYPLMDAVVLRFRHRQTGAELYYIANDDTNRAFDLTFFTEAIDNTGLPHVFEHATTAGSKKYPSAALWFNLNYQTYNTYMNALTGKRCTSYPCASLSEAQLLKYADYYTDSCLNPTLMENEQVFRTEAWRYRLEDAGAPLTLEGTVYSEMLGARTLKSAAALNAIRTLFPGSIAGNDSGGDPDCIPDLTWEALKAYHDRYYHPSNCAAYLYGRFDRYEAFLQLLDGYFSVYEAREFTHGDPGYTPITAPVTRAWAFPAEAGSETEDASVIYYGFVCPGLRDDPQQELVMNTLTDLLADGASDFQQSLQAAIPSGSFHAYIDSQGPEDAIVFTALNVDPEDAETFRATVDAALQRVAETGFPQAQVDGVMASLSLSALLTRENSDPVNRVILQMDSNYANSGDPWSYLDYQDGLFKMDEWNRQGLYAKGVSDWLIGSQTTALVTTYPEPGAKEEKDAALAEKLARIKAGMSDAEIAAIVAASNTLPEKEDASEYVARLQAVTVDSLPEELKLYDVTDETDAEGIRHIDARAGVEGVGKASVLLDAAGLPQADLHWFILYLDLLRELDTAAHTRAELATLFSRYLYGGVIGLSLPREGEEDYHPYLCMTWIARDEDLDEGYDLMREILFDTKLEDPAKLLEQVQALKAAFRSSVTADPRTVLLRRGLAAALPMFRYNAYVTDLAYYDFLNRAEALLESDPEAAIAKLKGIQAYFNNRTNAVTTFAGNADSIALNRKLADGFLASLDARPVDRVLYDLPVPARSEALKIDSNVQYNLLVADYGVLGLPGFTGDLTAVANIVNDTFLVPLLRDQYGVYTPQHAAIDRAGVFIIAYRDPNIAETFQVLDELPEMVADLDIDQETLNGYILSAYSGYAMPEGELSGAAAAASAALQGLPQDEALTWMRQLKGLTPEALKGYAELYAKLSDEGARYTAGGAAAIDAVSDMYDAILDPFGALDRRQVALADVGEGSEHYAAVRFAYEEGLMLPREGDHFDVDAPADRGDLLAALYAMTGGDADPEAALAAFAEYGLIEADTDLSGEIAPEDVWALLSAVSGEAVPALTETADPDTVTRGELAEALSAFVNSME